MNGTQSKPRWLQFRAVFAGDFPAIANCEPPNRQHAAEVLGWTADFFRFWWASFYWNTRKGWFRLLGAHRDDCPCQNSSDSGLARDTRCDAIIHWHRPERFRRVCPLLVETADGLRCSVEAERVRPFWGRAILAILGLLLVVYAVGTTAVYATLRTSGYQLGYLSVAWPQRWSEIELAREKLSAERARVAIESGNLPLAISSLEDVCRINPKNYHAGLTLARLTQFTGQSNVSEHVFERLMIDVPGERVNTARIWFRALLARGAYVKIIPLAAMMLGEDPERRAEWLHALLFAAQQNRDAQTLVGVLQANPHFPEWCTELITLESSVLQNRLSSVLPRLTEPRRPVRDAYVARYQMNTLLAHDEIQAATALLSAYADDLPADSIRFLRLQLHQKSAPATLLEKEFTQSLKAVMTVQTAEQLAACLVARPSAESARKYHAKLSREGPPLTSETLPLYHAAFIAAKISREKASEELLRSQLRAFTKSTDRNLEALGQWLTAPKTSVPLNRVLPLVPLPAEVVYTLVETQGNQRTP